MSMEAQFYEARRRQNWIERRQSLRTEYELEREHNKSKNHFTLNIPIRIVREEKKNLVGKCTCMPMQRSKITRSDQSLFQRQRDIYPRPQPLTNNLRRSKIKGKLLRRFTSIEYLQQW